MKMISKSELLRLEELSLDIQIQLIFRSKLRMQITYCFEFCSHVPLMKSRCRLKVLFGSILPCARSLSFKFKLQSFQLQKSGLSKRLEFALGRRTVGKK